MALSGQASLGLIGGIVYRNTVDLQIIATVSALGTSGSEKYGQMSLTGSAALSAIGQALFLGEFRVTGSFNLSVIGLALRTGQLSLTGSGWLSADATAGTVRKLKTTGSPGRLLDTSGTIDRVLSRV